MIYLFISLFERTFSHVIKGKLCSSMTALKHLSQAVRLCHWLDCINCVWSSFCQSSVSGKVSANARPRPTRRGRGSGAQHRLPGLRRRQLHYRSQPSHRWGPSCHVPKMKPYIKIKSAGKALIPLCSKQKSSKNIKFIELPLNVFCLSQNICTD